MKDTKSECQAEFEVSDHKVRMVTIVAYFCLFVCLIQTVKWYRCGVDGELNATRVGILACLMKSKRVRGEQIQESGGIQYTQR